MVPWMEWADSLFETVCGHINGMMMFLLGSDKTYRYYDYCYQHSHWSKEEVKHEQSYYGFLSWEQCRNDSDPSVVNAFSTMGSSFPNFVRTWNTSYKVSIPWPIFQEPLFCFQQLHNLPRFYNKVDEVRRSRVCKFITYSWRVKMAHTNLLKCYWPVPFSAETLNLSPYVAFVYFVLHQIIWWRTNQSRPANPTKN